MIKLCLPPPGGSDGKASAYNAGDPGSIPGSGRSSGEGNGNPVHNSCLENPMDGGAWLATVHGVPKSQTRLSNFTSLSLMFGHFGDNFVIISLFTCDFLSLNFKHDCGQACVLTFYYFEK